MDVPLDKINATTLEQILQAWVAVGGNDPEMAAKKIAGDIKKAVEGDSIARFSLDDGYRFGSRVGSSKLFFRVRGDQVEVGMHPNNPYARAEAEQEAGKVSAHFQEKLREIFSV